MEELKAIEITRLIEWLEDKGFTEAEILDCIKYIHK